MGIDSLCPIGTQPVSELRIVRHHVIRVNLVNEQHCGNQRHPRMYWWDLWCSCLHRYSRQCGALYRVVCQPWCWGKGEPRYQVIEVLALWPAGRNIF